ncbi:hypothetical protein INT48_009888 [Thamnidium elegans]|uniref:Uncharacterized protein n=1 Tax=Thamnidium elegans TaxID=101142 RepID=A0A8H7SM85_9FUNG|nr:hypothetical protein INT48_009888 [Thamnidium elegans]
MNDNINMDGQAVPVIEFEHLSIREAAIKVGFSKSTAAGKIKEWNEMTNYSDKGGVPGTTIPKEHKANEPTLTVEAVTDQLCENFKLPQDHPELLIASYESYIKDDIITLNKNSQESRRNFPKENRKRAKISPVQPEETYTHLDDASSPRVQLKPQSQPIPLTTQQPYIPQTTTNSQAITIQRKSLVGVIYEPSLLKNILEFCEYAIVQALHI